jgi:uncharacterized membrane protein YfcA
VATPLLALVLDVKTAVAVLIVPNIIMDGIQVTRLGGLVESARRFWILLLFGGIGTVVGTRLLVALSPRVATLVLATFVLAFVSLNAARVTLRIPPAWERWTGPPVGFVAGIIGGLTNVPGTPLVMYFYALGLPKPVFVRTVAFAFIVYKLVQLGAVTLYGVLTWPRVGLSLLFTAASLGAFALGVSVQERLPQHIFNRLVLAFLFLLGLLMLLRSLS